MLELDFVSFTENGFKVFIVAAFERITDFEETRFGEKLISYWHLISLKVNHSCCPHMHQCDCYTPTQYELTEYENEARELASKEAA